MLLSVPAYSFNWQLAHELESPLRVPAGTKIIATGAFDNSAQNSFNPDPGIEVNWGSSHGKKCSWGSTPGRKSIRAATTDRYSFADTEKGEPVTRLFCAGSIVKASAAHPARAAQIRGCH